MDFCAKEALANPCAAGNSFRRHPDIDAEPSHFRFPDMLVEIVGCKCTGKTKLPADGLADPLPVERPGEWIGETVRDRPVVFVAQIVGGVVDLYAFHDAANKPSGHLR